MSLFVEVGDGGGGLPMPVGEIFNGGFFDYNDVTTASSPIAITGGAGLVTLTNDGAGSFSNDTYKPAGMADIWDVVADEFDWTVLSLGDMVDIRLDVDVTTTSPNTEVSVVLQLGTGGGTYTIPFEKTVIKSSGTVNINRFNGIYMGDANTINNPGLFRAEADDDITVKVIGWYVKIIKRG